MLNLVLKGLGFVVALGAILIAVKGQDRLADVSLLGYKLAEVERLEPETVFVGSSHTFRHVDVARFDSLRGGGASYNLGIQGVEGLEVHYLAERLLGHPHLKRLVIELRPISVLPENRNTRRVYYYHDLRRARLGARVAFAGDGSRRARWQAALDRYALTLAHYSLVGQGEGLLATPQHGWEPLPALDHRGFSALDSELDLLEQSRSSLPRDKQVELTKRVARTRRRHTRFLSPQGQDAFAERVAVLRRRDRVQPSPQDVIEADIWYDLYERAREQGVAIYFVEQVGEEGVEGLVHALGKRLPPGRLIVLNDPVHYPEIFAVDLWFDIGHLTEEGARWVTARLAEQIP